MRNTTYLPRRIFFLSVLILGFVSVSVALAQNTPKDKHPGFASTTKPQYIVSENYEAEVKGDPNKPVDPNSVLDVRIIGNLQIGANDIIKIIKTRQGRPYSESILEEDKRALMQKGWFIDVKPKVEKTPSGYIVTFQFIERPILHYVKIVGNRAHTRKVLLEEANIKRGDALDPIAVRQARERMEQFYRDSGYHRVHIEIVSGDQIGDRGAVFWISEGPKARILGVEFEGNTIASGPRLKTLIESKPGWFLWINSEFTPKQLNEDVEKLTTYYRKLGFFYAKIDRKFEESSGYTGLGSNRAWITVKFVIDEGPRCRVRNIQFLGQHVFDKAKLLEIMKLPKEKYYNQDMLESDMARIKEEYGKVGYVFARAEPDTRIDDDCVDLVISIKEGVRCYVRSINVEIAGAEGAEPYTKLAPIMNRLSIYPGDILRTTEIAASERRLKASQLFNTNPTQGQIPEIRFSYPEEAIAEEEAEEAEKLASGKSQIRGQVRELLRQEPIFFEEEEKETSNDEASMENFSNFFRIRKPQPQSQVNVPNQPAYGQPAYGQPAYQPSNYNPQNYNRSVSAPQQSPMNPAYRAPYPPSSYQPMREPVEPLRLEWKKPVDGDAAVVRKETDVYRGQQAYFTQPRIQSPAPILYPQQNAVSTVPSTYQPTSGYSTSQYSSSPYSATNQYGSVSPAPVKLADATPGYAYGMTNSTYPNYSNTQATGVPIQGLSQNGMSSSGPYGNSTYNPYAVQTPVSTPPVPTYNPGTYYSQQNQAGPAQVTMPQNQYVGGNAVYNSGSVVLGAPNSNAIDNSAIRFDPKAPSGMSSKLYPTDVTTVVGETRTGQLMMSVAVSSDAGLMGRFVIEEQNFDILNLPKGWRLSDWKNAFRGKGQRFRIEAVPGTQVQRYEVSWQTPYLFNQDYSFGLSGYYYERFYDEWYEQRMGGTVSVGKLWTPDFSTSIVFNGQQVKIYRPIYPTPTDLEEALGHHPMYSLGLRANYDVRDSEYMPTEGFLISGGVEQVFGDYRFVRGNIDFRKYFMLHERPDRSGRWVLGLRSSLGISEKGTPIYERYYGGGFTNLRGFEFRGVSPRDPNGIIIGGLMEFYNSAELIFPITADDMIRGAVFLDTGTIETSIKDWNSKYRASIGFGLRLTIPMMGPAPIALDFAFPLSKDPYDDKQIFSFNVGLMR